MFRRLSRHGDALLLLWLPVLLFHGKIVFRGQVICGGDFINQFVPWREFALREVSQGHFPAWNPYVFCGAPFAANIQTSLFYPWNLLHSLFSVEYTFSLSLVFHHALALLAMYFFLHRSGLSKGAAVFGATVYGWSGFFITHANDGHLIHLYAYAWIPLALECQSRLMNGFSPRRLFALAGVLSLLFYAGHTQIPLYVFYLLSARSVWWAAAVVRSSGSWRVGLRLPLQTLAALLFSLGLAALVLLPLLELSRYTAGRAGGADYEFATSDSLPPSHLITLLAPFFYGHPTHPQRESQFWETGTGYHEIGGYTGVLSLLLFILAFLPAGKGEGRPSLRRRDLYFFAVLALAGLFFSLGRYNPLYPLLYYGLPGWSYFRVPGRLVLFFILGVSVVSAGGLDRFLTASAGTLKNTSAFKAAVLFTAAVGIAVAILFLSREPLLSVLRDIEVDRTITALGLPADSRLEIDRRLPRILFDIRFGWMAYSLVLAFGLLLAGWGSLFAARRKEPSWREMLPAAVLLLDLILFAFRFVPTLPLPAWRETHFPQTELVAFLQQNVRGCRVLCLDDAIGHPGLAYHPELRPNRLMHYEIESVRGYDPIILRTYVEFINRLYQLPADSRQGGLLFFPQLPPAITDVFGALNIGYIVTTQNLDASYELAYSEPNSPIKVYKNPHSMPRFFWRPSGQTPDPLAQAPGEVRFQPAAGNAGPTEILFWSQSYYPGWTFEDSRGNSYPCRKWEEGEAPGAPFLAADRADAVAFAFRPTAHIRGGLLSGAFFMGGLWMVFRTGSRKRQHF